MEKSNKNKGITLIALVITIIVMLILVAVTITMAVNGGLFNYAGKAAGETQNVINEEQALGNGGVTIGDKYYNSIDEYINEGKTEGIDWEALLADATENPDKYLQQAAEVGQDIEENTTIGIGTNGKVVNMDLWLYEYALTNYDYYDRYNTKSPENGYMLNKGHYDTDGMEYTFPHSGTDDAGYRGTDLENIIIPQYIKSSDDEDFIPVTSLPYTFDELAIVTPPEIPSTVEDLWRTFNACENLTSIPEINDNVIFARGTFGGCVSLNGVVRINSKNLEDVWTMFTVDGTENALTTIQVPENSKTYESIYEEYGNKENIIIETFK